MVVVLGIAGLALIGAEITASGFERSTAEQAVDDWFGDDTDLLDADGLAGSLADRPGREITLDLRQQLQEHTVVDSG